MVGASLVLAFGAAGQFTLGHAIFVGVGVFLSANITAEWGRGLETETTHRARSHVLAGPLRGHSELCVSPSSISPWRPLRSLSSASSSCSTGSSSPPVARASQPATSRSSDKKSLGAFRFFGSLGAPGHRLLDRRQPARRQDRSSDAWASYQRNRREIRRRERRVAQDSRVRDQRSHQRAGRSHLHPHASIRRARKLRRQPFDPLDPDLDHRWQATAQRCCARGHIRALAARAHSQRAGVGRRHLRREPGAPHPVLARRTLRPGPARMGPDQAGPRHRRQSPSVGGALWRRARFTLADWSRERRTPGSARRRKTPQSRLAGSRPSTEFRSRSRPEPSPA